MHVSGELHAKRRTASVKDRLQDTLSKVRSRIKFRQFHAEVVDLRDSDDEHIESMTLAGQIAELVRLKPTLHGMSADAAGRFSINPEEVVVSTFHREDDDDLWDMAGKFSFRTVNTPEAAAGIAAELEARAEKKERWPISKWLERAISSGMTVIVAERPGTDQSAGFLAFRRAVSVYVFDDGGRELDYTLTPEYVYISPDCRGMRISTAMVRVVMEDAYADIPHLAKLLRSRKIQELGPPEFNARISGEAHSIEGLRFMDSLCSNLEDVVEEEFAIQGSGIKHRVEADYTY